MISWMILPYYVLFFTATVLCTVIMIVGSATIRANTAYSCPGTEVVFTCVVNTTLLSWDIYFLSGDNINRVLFYPSDSIGRHRQLSPRTSQGTVYTFNLTSKSPLTSTMTTIASTDLSGAMISCRDGITGSFHINTLVVEIVPEPQKPRNVTAVMPLIYPGYDAADSLNITLQWDDESRDPMYLGNYTIAVYPEAVNSGSIFYTIDTSMPLALHYDQDYNISVVASNCVGNSIPAEIWIRLVHCGPSVGKDVSSTRGNQAHKLKTYCLHSPGLVFAPDETKPDKSTLSTDCNKNGSIRQHGTTSEILVPVLTASHLLLSLCTLIVGLLLGSLSHRCFRRKKSSKTMQDKKFVSSVEEPVYSEIPPKTVPSVYRVSESVKSVDNVAYGQVSP